MEEKVCTSCGRDKQMYYGLWCPICEKPMPESTTFYNLLKCMYHIEALGHKGFKDKLWTEICYIHNVSNDIMIEISNCDGEGSDEVKLLFDTFKIKEESMSFYISW